MCNSNSELKLKFKNDFQQVSILVNEFDPCGFIHGGAPEDEYDCLTNRLLSAAYNDNSYDEIKELILYQIEHHFGTPDLTILSEPYKTEFYRDIDILINKLRDFEFRIPK